MNNEEIEKSMKDIEKIIKQEFADERTTCLEISFLVTRSGLHKVFLHPIRENLIQ